jgi:HK97 family phage major capsid protein
MQAAAKKSVMMGLVRHRPMIGPSIFLPTRERGGVQLHWLTAYGQQITGSKPHGVERVELKAYTLAGYIPWYDEFEEDVFTDLGAMFVDEFVECYGQEFDRQCLLANSVRQVERVDCLMSVWRMTGRSFSVRVRKRDQNCSGS